MIASEAFLRGNSIAMQQYQNICRLRAIEFSKFLFKSSNAGISSVIDERGEVVTFKRASKSVELLSCVGYTNNVKTFYSTWGWVTNKLPVFVLVILILFIIFLPVIGSKSKFVA
jgi:apolipoprotein N-acyltransferase